MNQTFQEILDQEFPGPGERDSNMENNRNAPLKKEDETADDSLENVSLDEDLGEEDLEEEDLDDEDLDEDMEEEDDAAGDQSDRSI